MNKHLKVPQIKKYDVHFKEYLQTSVKETVRFYTSMETRI
jgi:hypothetical protein